MSRQPNLVDRRTFLAASAAALRGQSPRAGPRKPNIIFILADDLGCFDLGCYGQTKIRTPNIDRLAAEGMKFDQCYAGATVCAPSRSCLMTGLHTGHTTVRANHSVRTGERVPLRAEDVTVAEVLRGAGYSTGAIGKWGLGEPGTAGLPNRQGFDHWFGYLNQDHAIEYYTDYLWRNAQKVILEANRNGRRGQYTHDLFTREALDFIRGRRRPFFLYLAYTIPHAKHEVPSDAPYSAEPWTQQQKNYAAMVTRMDRDVGRVVVLLKETGLDRDTLVFFSSDNGAGFREGLDLFRSTGALRGRKGDVYEGGHRAPMIARWPGRIQAGSVSRQVWAFWDFLPTAAELVGAATPAHLDGVSIAPTLLGNEQEQQHEFLYWEAHSGRGFQQAVRMGDWKAVRHGLDGPLELYDLGRDPGERSNVAAGHAVVVARIQAFLGVARTEALEYPARSGAGRRG